MVGVKFIALWCAQHNTTLCIRKEIPLLEKSLSLDRHMECDESEFGRALAMNILHSFSD